MIDPKKIRALTFDCYGTLIDWETGLKSVLNGWAEDVGVAARDETLLESFGRHEIAIEIGNPAMLYSDVMREVMRRLCNEYGVVATDFWIERLAQSVGEWPAFFDSAEALIKLQRRFKLCILSNVDRTSFRGSNKKLCVDFHLVMTAQDIGSYKPDLRNFRAILEKLKTQGINQDEVLHVAQSLYHDHVPSARIGLRSVWINRRHDKEGAGATVIPETMPQFEREFSSMREFAAWACFDLSTERLTDK